MTGGWRSVQSWMGFGTFDSFDGNDVVSTRCDANELKTVSSILRALRSTSDVWIHSTVLRWCVILHCFRLVFFSFLRISFCFIFAFCNSRAFIRFVLGGIFFHSTIYRSLSSSSCFVGFCRGQQSIYSLITLLLGIVRAMTKFCVAFRLGNGRRNLLNFMRQSSLEKKFQIIKRPTKTNGGRTVCWMAFFVSSKGRQDNVRVLS